jgi:hypothetical protein
MGAVFCLEGGSGGYLMSLGRERLRNFEDSHCGCGCDVIKRSRSCGIDRTCTRNMPRVLWITLAVKQVSRRRDGRRRDISRPSESCAFHVNLKFPKLRDETLLGMRQMIGCHSARPFVTGGRAVVTTPSTVG